MNLSCFENSLRKTPLFLILPKQAEKLQSSSNERKMKRMYMIQWRLWWCVLLCVILCYNVVWWCCVVGMLYVMVWVVVKVVVRWNYWFYAVLGFWFMTEWRTYRWTNRRTNCTVQNCTVHCQNCQAQQLLPLLVQSGQCQNSKNSFEINVLNLRLKGAELTL